MRSRTPDRLCAEAVDVALAVTQEAAGPHSVGEHLGVIAEGDRVVTHLFACKEPAYRGWRWATTLTRASRAKTVTIDETVLLPGSDAVLAPEWVPWSERLRPGDMGPGDLLPTEADDLRLEPGWVVGEGSPIASAAVPLDLGVDEDDDEFDGADAGARRGVLPTGAELLERGGSGGSGGGDGEGSGDGTGTSYGAGPGDGTGAGSGEGAGAGFDSDGEPELVELPSIARIASVATEIGMGRARVLSRYGLHTAADRWDEQFGPKSPMAQAAPAHCVSCGFLVPIAGSLGQAFGICANEFSPADGRLVSLAYGCGAHSEAAVMPKTPHPAPMVLDDLHDTDPLPLHPDRHSSVEDGEPAEDDLGHS